MLNHGNNADILDKARKKYKKPQGIGTLRRRIGFGGLWYWFSADRL